MAYLTGHCQKAISIFKDHINEYESIKSKMSCINKL